MNKMAKGAIATAAGVVLLIGGGGTLAWWSDTAESKAGTIATGDLDLHADNNSWSLQNGGTIDIATYKMVPGDVLVFTQDVDITVKGNNLAADLTPVLGGVASGLGNAKYSVTTSLQKDGVDVQMTNLKNVDIDDATATITFTFDGEGTLGQAGVNGSYNFDKVGFSLVQQSRTP